MTPEIAALAERVPQDSGPTAGFHVWLTEADWDECHQVLERGSEPVQVFGWKEDTPDMLGKAFGYRVVDQCRLDLSYDPAFQTAATSGSVTPLQAFPSWYDALLFVFQNKREAQLFKVKFSPAPV
ncbi:hypothetical protein E5554_15955 [Sphingobium sp. PAMC28499]|uniref:hypothetical protein n=1 Tax=Sphingobium sp. PAMC28499 TaxID=2565554 RepID=UPI00109DB8A3|nr:hypothetical protein [Sphingobium sp. PAMC28499]QCB39187.1 hypothetical protein E5554_15955 [Sphingobium sp. PAMC28499]